MKYNVSFNRNGYASLTITETMSDSNTYSINYYYNFDLSTGAILRINDIIEDSQFKNLFDQMLAEKKIQAKNIANSFKEKLKSKLLDSTGYKKALQITNRCDGVLLFSFFTLNDNSIEIKDECVFPESIERFFPTFNYTFKYESIKEFLTEKFASKIK